ncbi:MAG: hypothetical protein JW732_09805 [Dehalococcoidia bacterium]|nr:hypothetical protein [Dehalococcoidia bacterium]
MKRPSQIISSYMSKTTGISEHCARCLRTERWDGSVVLMIVDAAFTSIGLNYFTAVVPKVMKFKKDFVDCGRVKDLESLSNLPEEKTKGIWRNRRSWQAAKSISSYLYELGKMKGLDERRAFRFWAANSQLDGWREDPIGKISGVGMATFQYLRMMGGVDTAMPDKIVRRVVRQILDEAGLDMPTEREIDLVRTIEQLSELSGYRPIEICWMTWLIQPEGKMIRMSKYRNLLDKI